MKILIALLVLCLTSCESSSKPTLHLFAWGDYLAPEVLEQFQKEYNCNISIDTFDSNESMYAKLKLGSNSYDLIFPSQYYLGVLHSQKMIQSIDAAKIHNLQNLDPRFEKLTTAQDLQFGLPFAISATGIAYRKDKVKNFDPSWMQFARIDLKGRMTMLNDYREVIGAALQVLGFSINTTNPQEIDQAVSLCLTWKHNLAKFENEQYKNGIASGEYVISQAFSGDTLQVMAENKNVGFQYAKEGTAVAMDFVAIPLNAPNLDLAYAFLNYLLEPTVAAKNIAFTHFLFPNKEAYALLSDDLRNSPVLFPPQTVLDKSETVHDLGNANRLYIEAWDKIKAGS